MINTHEHSFKFKSINRSRKDIYGYKTRYKLTIFFSLLSNDEKLKNIIVDKIEKQVIDYLSEIDLSSLIENTDNVSLLDWIIRKLRKIFPIRNAIIIKATLSEEGKKDINQNFISIKNKIENIIIYNDKIKINNSEKSTKNINFSKKFIFFRKIINELQLQNNVGQVNKFTNKPDWKSIEDLLKNTNEDIYLCNYICPPYVNDEKLGYIGLFDSVVKNPREFNFDYDYIKIISNLEKVILLGKKLQLPIRGLIVFCDWGLINIDGIKSTLKTDLEIQLQLRKFKDSLDDLSLKYSEINVIGLSQMGIADYLPLGLPFSSKERKKFLNEISKNEHKIFSIIDRDFFTKTLSWINDQNLIRFLDWKNFNELSTWGILKEDIINIIKTYENILWMKINKKYFKSTKDLMRLKANKELREEAFYDALLRYVEYKTYGQITSLRFSKTICLYQDTGFPVAGHHFRNHQMPIIFLDPNITQEKLKFEEN